MKRLECLDGLRGVLAVYVLLGHLAPFALLPQWVQHAVSHGGAAVDLFFVLSGLVITQSLARAAGQAAPYLIARATRIFPVFLAAFALAVAVQPMSCGFDDMPWIGAVNPARTICVSTWPQDWVPEILAHIFMIHGLFPKAVLPDIWVSFLGSAWSLSTEWQFYLLALMLAGYRGRLGWVLLGLAGAGLAWRWIGPDEWQFSRAFLLNKAHFFALGVASLPVVLGQRGAVWHYGAVLAGTLAICAAEGQTGKVMAPLFWTMCLAGQMGFFPLLAWTLRLRLLQWLGMVSYCLYLVNEPIHKILGVVLARIAAGDAALFTWLWLPAAIGVPILASVGLHVWLELPALRWGRAIAFRSAVIPCVTPSGQVPRAGL